jgi:hypothetical protein
LSIINCESYLLFLVFTIVSDMILMRKTQEAAQMAWPMERPFYPEEVRQPDVGSSGVGGTSEEEPDN